VEEAGALAQARAFPGLQGMDLAREVSTAEGYEWREASWQLNGGYTEPAVDASYFHVVVFDFGVKRNILRMLVDRVCRVTVVPAKTPAAEVLAMQPDGVFLSNGPGDPEPCDYAITAIQALLETDTPLFGICLGHQLLALASGAGTAKMKFGHHGANHPVQNLGDGTVLITSQNHGFAVDESTLPETLEATHRSLFDQSLQGIHHRDRPAFGFQGHPEASPGPHDAAPLFNHFIELMQARRD
jgi:carbamoyl-phosphate synthase small subunit